MPSSINERTVAELAGKLRGVRNAVLVDFTGLKAVQADALRARLGELGARMLVVKNTLAAKALAEVGLGATVGLLTGPIALVCGEDAPALLRMLREWSRKERVLKWRGAIADGEVVGPEGMEALATLPPLAALRAQAIGAIAAPLTGLLGALQGIVRQLVNVLDAIAEKRQGEG